MSIAADEIRARDAAVLVGLSEKTLANMRAAGEGASYVKRGRLVYYSRSGLLAWHASRISEVHEMRVAS